MKKLFSFSLLYLCVVFSLSAQVDFSVAQKRVSPTQIDLVFTGKISPGWHVYSTDVPDGGPVKASFNIDNSDGVELAGPLKAGPGVKSAHDDIFDMQVSYFENSCTFTQSLKLTKKEYNLKGYMEFGACNDENCMPPTAVDCSVKGSDGPDASSDKGQETSDKEQVSEEKEKADADAALAPAEAADEAALAAAADSAALSTVNSQLSTVDSAALASWYAPSIDQLKALGEDSSTSGRSLWYIFLMGLLGGFVAILTPCVWPIIPMTVSFFLHRNENKEEKQEGEKKKSSFMSKGLRDALLYGLSIIVIYVALGLIITSLFGASALNDLSTNAIFNILFFLLLLIFAASFLGGFEITLPSSWSNKIDSKANSATGILSIFLMAFTLALVSFSCTGPIIGFLLVEVSTAGSSILAPAIGMLGFAIALALPFTLFALFPTMLKKAPKSGGWLNTVKVVLGFIELAFALKFLSVADLAYGWHLLDRETFLCLWIVIFALLGAYLIGWLRFPNDDEQEHTSVPRFFMALISFAFAIYMVPGLWGAPCKAVSAFAPPITTQDFNLNPIKVEAKFRDYDAGMAYAKQTGKPVLLDFTGYGCVNCRKMELAVWHDARVRDLLLKDYVLISLYVDDKTRLPEPVEVQENGKTTTLRTIGDKWSYLERHKFGANAQPLYVPVDNEGNPLNHSASYDENVSKYVQFLKEGLANYRK